MADTSFDTAIQSVLDEANNQPSLDARKEVAKQALIAEANKQKAAIDADLTLSPADKAAQKAKIDAILADAEQKLAAADSYDDVLAINADAITAMEVAHQSGNGLYVEPKAAEAPKVKTKATLPATAQRVDRHASAGLLAAASLSLGAFFAAKKKSKKQG